MEPETPKDCKRNSEVASQTYNRHRPYSPEWYRERTNPPVQMEGFAVGDIVGTAGGNIGKIVYGVYGETGSCYVLLQTGPHKGQTRRFTRLIKL